MVPYYHSYKFVFAVCVSFHPFCGEGCHGKAKRCFSQPPTIHSMLSMISGVFFHCAPGDCDTYSLSKKNSQYLRWSLLLRCREQFSWQQ